MMGFVEDVSLLCFSSQITKNNVLATIFVKDIVITLACVLVVQHYEFLIQVLLACEIAFSLPFLN